MTVIYTETHLTSDPVFQQDTAFFTVALSAISVQCHIHREENIRYIRNNQIRTGDLVRLHGVFMTSHTDVYYIKISSLALMTNLKLSKKRKIDDVMKGDTVQSWDDQSSSDSTYMTSRNKSASPPAKPTLERSRGLFLSTEMEEYPYIEVEGCFSNYFFMMLGKVQFVCQQVHNFQYHHQKDLVDEIDCQLIKCQTENMNLLNGILQQIYTMYIELTQHELNKLAVLNFVITVKSLVDKMCELLVSCNYIMPQALVIDRRVPLPSFIYNYHIKS
jgi:hypothetical protein